ncbi:MULTISPECIES: hypothetical protein [Kitasatospora]|uniref:Uncharacterized protein n=1 Tax=Kitasatospora cathayae TaxID=3004092 RepID=A0ABY7PWK8_9ACTN|nr:hypothetical protein [Kitasatospora sp. HUAS 3-15]WBP84799.1 hypothetical protein O1G21_02350 [Kitasatospora sp. HUAS 3-15]
MADGTGDSRAQGPVVWALAVRQAAQGPPVAELIVEVGANLHADLVEAAVDSGFTVAAGEPPATTGLIEVADGRVERLVLIGGRQGWEPGSRVEVSPRWLAAAEGRGEAVVVVVPPQDRPVGPGEEDLGARVETFTRWVEEQRLAGRVLHGAVSVRGWA